MLRSLVRPESVFFLLVWSSFLFLFRERGFYDPGSLWHVRVGELILDHGFMWTDPFTYTFADHTWIPQQWGAEVLMALAHRAGGFDTMLLGFSTLVAILFTWVFSRMRAAGMHPLLAGVLTGGCLFAGSFHFFVRPHMFTIAFLGWTMGCLIDFERGRATIARLAGLIPLYILWTNLHGGVLGGVFTLGLAVAGWGLEWWGGGVVRWWKSKHHLTTSPPHHPTTPIRNWRTAWLLVGIVASCALTPFDSPFGMELINTWKRIVGSSVLKEVVNEHKPINLAQAVDRVIVSFGVVYLLLLAGTLPRRPRVTWLIPVVWFALTFKGIRQGPLFAITASLALADFWPHTVWHRLLKRYGDSLVHDPDEETRSGLFSFSPLLPFSPSGVLPALAVLVALFLQIRAVPVPVVGHGWARLDPTYSPVPLTDQLKEYAHTAGPNARIYNDANLGGYLIYHVPELKIFMDDRFELYGDDWTREYADIYWNAPERIEEYMDRYNLELALVVTGPDGMPLDNYLSTSPRWREIGRAECAVLYRRIKP